MSSLSRFLNAYLSSSVDLINSSSLAYIASTCSKRKSRTCIVSNCFFSSSFSVCSFFTFSSGYVSFSPYQNDRGLRLRPANEFLAPPGPSYISYAMRLACYPTVTRNLLSSSRFSSCYCIKSALMWLCSYSYAKS